MESKKRILFFIPEFPVLSETFIERELSKLVSRGNLDIVILSIKQGSGYLSENLADKLHYKRLDAAGIVRATILVAKKPFHAIKALGKIFPNPNRSIVNSLYLYAKSLGYAAIVDDFSPDQIHAHFMSEPSTIMMVVSILLDIPLSISGHARDVFGNSEDIRLNPELVKTKVSQAEFVTICNRHAVESCLSLFDKEKPQNVYLEYHGVDFDEIKRLSEVDPIEKPPVTVIASIGTRLVEKKGHKYLIEASEILKLKGIAHKIYIAGPGPLYTNLLEEISNRNVEDTVSILGNGEGLPFSELAKYYHISDLYVFSGIKASEGDEDGLPNVLVESAALKIPIVSTIVGSVGDLIDNGKTGLLVSQKDPKELVKAIETLINDKELGVELAENAFTKASEFLDMNKTVVNLEKHLLSS